MSMSKLSTPLNLLLRLRRHDLQKFKLLAPARHFPSIGTSWKDGRLVSHQFDLSRRNLSTAENEPKKPKDNKPDEPRYKYLSTFSAVLGGTIGAILYYVYYWENIIVEAAKPIDPAQYEKDDIYVRRGSSGSFPTDNSGSFKGPKRRQDFNFVADVVESVGNTVVCIELKDNRNVDWVTGKPQVLSNGSGFIVSEDGLILTNAHVVSGNKGMCVTVKLHDGRCFSAKIEDIDLNSDLAVIRINARGLPIMPLGTSSTTRIGEWVVALGSPLSLANTVTAGVVSSMDRKALELGINTNNISYIQTDAAITFGNSGGPLVNMDGEAIGINSMKVTAGISFAIPIDYVKVYLSEAEKRRAAGKQKAKRRYIGATLLTLSDDIVAEMHANNTLPYQVSRGILVWKVVVGSPSYQAGLKPGDVIYGINKVAVSSAQEIFEQLKTIDFLNLHIKRSGQDLIVKVYPEDVES